MRTAAAAAATLLRPRTTTNGDDGLAVFGFGGTNVNGDLAVVDTDPDMYAGFGDADLAGFGGHDAEEGITF